MLKWFQGNQINIFRSFLRRLKLIAAQEIKDAAKLSAGYEIYEEMTRLVGEENTEKALEGQLIHEFRNRELMLRQKSAALTDQLGKRIMDIARILQGTGYAVVDLEEAVRKGDRGSIALSRRKLSEELVNLERETNLAEELVKYLSQVEQIPNILCTAEFARRLNSNDFRGQLKEIEILLEKMSNPEWLSHNSKRLFEVPGKTDFFSCPRGEINLRMIYKIQGNAIVVYDVMRHREYEAFFASGKGNIAYHGTMAVFRPLAAFARLAGAR